MESTGEGEAVTPYSRMDSKDPLLTDWKPQSEQTFIKQENLLTDGQPETEQIYIKEENILLTDGQPETEQIYIKEENIKLEAPEDHYGSDPLKEEPGEYVSEEETSYPTDEPYLYIKQDPECMLEEETTTPPGPTQIGTGLQESSCGSETESGVEENRSNGLPTGLGNPTQCTDNEKASCDPTSARKYLVLSCTMCKKTFANLHDLKEHNCMNCVCDICQKSFKISSKVDTGNCITMCRRCDKLARRSMQPKQYSSRCGECPYPGEVFHKAFPCKSDQRDQSRVHTS